MAKNKTPDTIEGAQTDTLAGGEAVDSVDAGASADTVTGADSVEAAPKPERIGNSIGEIKEVLYDLLDRVEKLESKK